jgi:DNA repair protein RadC
MPENEAETIRACGMTGSALIHFPAPEASTVPVAIPADEHPIYRLRHHGAAALSDAELLTLVLRSHVRNADEIAAARRLLRDGIGHLVRYANDGTRHLRRRDAVRIAAAIEFARRASSASSADHRQHFDATAFARTLMTRYSSAVQERLGAVLLDSRDRVLVERELFVGTLQSAFVSTRDIVLLALDHHAAGVVVYHNHPSGDPSPSEEDLTFTARLRTAAALLDVKVLDHIVVGGGRYVSFHQRGYI